MTERDPLEIWPGQDWRAAAAAAAIENEAHRNVDIALRVAGQRRARAIAEERAAQEECREAVRWARDLGLSTAEIAEGLGVSEMHVTMGIEEDDES